MGRKIYQSSLIRAHAKKILNKRVSQYSRGRFTDKKIFIKARSVGSYGQEEVQSLQDSQMKFEVLETLFIGSIINKAPKQSHRAI